MVIVESQREGSRERKGFIRYRIKRTYTLQAEMSQEKQSEFLFKDSRQKSCTNINQVRRGKSMDFKKEKKIIPSNRQNGKKVQMSSFQQENTRKKKKINLDFEHLEKHRVVILLYDRKLYFCLCNEFISSTNQPSCCLLVTVRLDLYCRGHQTHLRQIF